jgi:hypothetical protein
MAAFPLTQKKFVGVSISLRLVRRFHEPAKEDTVTYPSIIRFSEKYRAPAPPPALLEAIFNPFQGTCQCA